MARTLQLPNRARLPVEALNRSAARRATRRGFDPGADDQPIDSTRFFVCPTLTPLYYAAVYRELSPAQVLRYNQLTGMCFNELISFFEQSFAHTALTALCNAGPAVVAPELLQLLHTFMAEEREHWEMWRRLNRLSAPDRYASDNRRIVRVPAPVNWLLRQLSCRPTRFPVVIWVMLALEEHSIEISRRCARMPAGQLEPHYAAAYRRHMEDEARHVQTDWHLLERLYAAAPPRVRRLNAWLFKSVMGRFFLRPTNSAVRVFDVLAAELPELAPLRPRVVRELKALDRDIHYQRMMYSRTSTPITFGLFDQFPEFRGIADVLSDYQPGWSGASVPCEGAG